MLSNLPLRTRSEYGALLVLLVLAALLTRCWRLQRSYNGLSTVSRSPDRPSSSSAYLVKHVLELILRQRRAFDILDCAKILRHLLAVLPLDGCHPLLCQLVFYRVVFPEIHLRADYQARHAGAMVMHLGEPFLADVLKGGGRSHGKADQEDVGLRV